jgi:hypothetical protein
MTQVDTGTTAPAPPREEVPAGAAPAPKPAPQGTVQQRSWLVGAATLGLAIVFALGFFVYLYGLSGLSESRAQVTMFKNFVYDLGQGTAPVSPYTQGADGKQDSLAEWTPVAVLDIPKLGLHNVVVVEGTSSRDLALGPGHVAASALPGQTGMSFLYGKSATYGAPFAHLMQLNRGDLVKVTTGQWTATYKVMSFGTSDRPAPVGSTNRLVLETAAPGLMPNSAVQVSADLVSQAQPNPGNWPQIAPQQSYMARDTADSLVPLVLWSQALLLALLVSTFAVYRWHRWETYLMMAPLVLALTWCVYENLACMLPNLY